MNGDFSKDVITDIVDENLAHHNKQCQDSPLAPKQPDPDTIKMFVGQIPRSYDDKNLLKIFEEYGPVYQLNILKDKATNQSRGCCFVTYYHRKDAVAAQCALHDIVTLPGMHHSVQMKPADTENRNDRKLFIGMLNKSMTEQDVQNLFSSFGSLEDCAILKDNQGNSRGCAFVTFASRQCALNAIKSLHHSQTMEGCNSPLVVKLADTQKDKDQKKIGSNSSSQSIFTSLGMPNFQKVHANPLLNMLQNSSVNSLTPQQQLAMMATPSQMGNYGQGYNSSLSNLLSLSNLMANGLNHPGLNSLALQNLAALSAMNNYPVGSTASPFNNNAISSSFSNLGTMSISSLLASKNTLNPLSCLLSASSNNQNSLNMPAMSSGHSYYKANSPTSACSQMSNIPLYPTETSANSYCGAGSSLDVLSLSQIYSKLNQYTANLASLSNNATSSQQVVGKQLEGPEGGNLFIYHLPQEFTDLDLAQTFQAFGNVLSAKVFVDKQTNLSKCFGFISYDNASSAQAAIQAMNGFQIGTKRLKVQLKRSKQDNKPYSHNNITLTSN